MNASTLLTNTHKCPGYPLDGYPRIALFFHFHDNNLIQVEIQPSARFYYETIGRLSLSSLVSLENWILSYLQKQPSPFPLPLKLPFPPFTKKVLELIQKISFGKTWTYSQIATMLPHSMNLNFGLSSSDAKELTQQIFGFARAEDDNRSFPPQRSTSDTSKLPANEVVKPKTHVLSARAVGNSCGKNPYPFVIPCHRVVANRGIGGFSSPLMLKKELLDFEKSS
ncbi:MAG: MGMT family protein [Chlamydiales bacterium]